MRTILFRGKRIDNGEWVEGYLIDQSEIRVYDDDKTTGFYTEDDYEVDPATVGQFTGLVDKNENKIFEGDIVKFVDANSEPIPFSEVITSIVWWNEFSRFTLKNTHTELSFLETDDMEVIGNIHYNPELI